MVSNVILGSVIGIILGFLFIIVDIIVDIFRKNKKKEKDTERSRKLTGFIEFKTDDLIPLICKNCENRAKNTTYCTQLEREVKAADYCLDCVVRRERNDI